LYETLRVPLWNHFAKGNPFERGLEIIEPVRSFTSLRAQNAFVIAAASSYKDSSANEGIALKAADGANVRFSSK